MKIVRSLEESGLIIKAVGETTENRAKDEVVEFLRLFLGTLGAIFWEIW